MPLVWRRDVPTILVEEGTTATVDKVGELAVEPLLANSEGVRVGVGLIPAYEAVGSVSTAEPAWDLQLFRRTM